PLLTDLYLMSSPSSSALYFYLKKPIIISKGVFMANQYTIDCSKFPSADNCDLKISGSNKEAVVETAFQHATGPMHNHKKDEPGLKDKIAQMAEASSTNSKRD